MGYSILQDEDREFRIKADQLPAAAAAVSNALHIVPPLTVTDLLEVLKAEQWEVTVDQSTGDVIDITFTGDTGSQTLKEEDVLYHLAPFVEPGSYITMSSSDDDNLWRWKFDGKKVKTVYPTITWEG